MSKKPARGRVLLVFALLLAGTTTPARAQLCWECVLDAPLPLGNYHCRRSSGPTAAASCNDFGGSSYPCAMGSPCDPTLAATVRTVRPDGVMTLSIGLNQLVQEQGWLQGGKPFAAALAELLPALTETARAQQTISESPDEVFSMLFAAPANSGGAVDEACKGHRVVRSYTEEEVALLRSRSEIVEI